MSLTPEQWIILHSLVEQCDSTEIASLMGHCHKHRCALAKCCEECSGDGFIIERVEDNFYQELECLECEGTGAGTT